MKPNRSLKPVRFKLIKDYKQTKYDFNVSQSKTITILKLTHNFSEFKFPKPN